jgi:hypothetical protein
MGSGGASTTPERDTLLAWLIIFSTLSGMAGGISVMVVTDGCDEKLVVNERTKRLIEITTLIEYSKL